jgi:hypothetical protein
MHLYYRAYIIFQLVPVTGCLGHIRTDRPGKTFAESLSGESQSYQALRAETRILRSCGAEGCFSITIDSHTIVAAAARYA